MIISRLGYCKSYNFCLKLENALNDFLVNGRTHTTPNIVIGKGNFVFPVEWDNLNKMFTNIHDKGNQKRP